MTLEDWRKQQYRDLRVIAEDERNRHRRQAGRAHMYALEIPVSVIVGAVLGKLLDDHFHIAPWGITIGLLAGLGAAGRAIYRIIQWQRTLSDGDTAQDIGYDPPVDDRDGYDFGVPPGGDHDRHK
jgi:F0F1-type ATP synthase assembly protein I